MNSPEQQHKQESEVKNAAEGKEKLQLDSDIQALREVAEQFNALEDEAKTLLDKGDAVGYTEKLRARARLLIDLPDRFASTLEGVDRETKEQILYDVSCFATAAQEALDSEGNFSLGVLLTHRGDKLGDKNDLEKLIESLENK